MDRFRDHRDHRDHRGAALQPGTGLYLHRRVPAPAGAACAALDEMVWHDAIDRRTENGRLTVRPAPALAAGQPARWLTGTLWAGWWRPGLPVEVTLSAWSRDESELGARPARRARRPRDGAEWYFTALGELLDALAIEVLWMVRAAAVTDAGAPDAGLRRVS